MTDLDRVAVHEAAHACAALAYGRSLSVVSIRPGGAHAGVTMGAVGHGPSLSALIDGRHALDGLVPEARRYADQSMVITTIGDVAVELRYPPSGYQSDPEAPQSPPPVGPDLPPAVAERLADSEARTELLDDDSLAFEQARGVVGATAGLYLVWIRAEARVLAASLAEAITELAAALRASPTGYVDGQMAADIYRAHLERSGST